jgi:hypothetical protein
VVDEGKKKSLRTKATGEEQVNSNKQKHTSDLPQRTLQIRPDDWHGCNKANDNTEKVGKQPKDAVELDKKSDDGPAQQDHHDSKEEARGAPILFFAHKE